MQSWCALDTIQKIFQREVARENSIHGKFDEFATIKTRLAVLLANSLSMAKRPENAVRNTE
ncbi:hypothetical protein A3734_13795 [Sulfitobacter sp. HI0054]|nr:hypothetical protein A3734_13795 [Sulfitobacter sp. HI0054]